MKGLYINTIATSSTDLGVAKKIESQILALEKHSIKMDYLTRENSSIDYKYLFNGIEIKETNFSRKFLKKIYYYFFYPKKNKLLRKIKVEKYDFIYIRAYVLTYGGMDFLKNLKKTNAKIIWEIPTYPYDQECKTLESKLLNTLEKIFFRKKLKKYVNKIVTYSDDNEIFNIKTIKISNGIDMERISMVNKLKKTISDEINFITVARISFWHGIDRFILSMVEYYKNNPKEIIKFHIVGDGDKNLVNELKKIVKDNNLEKYVIFYGYKSGKELDEIYNRANIAIGCLGNHRKGISYIQPLKNREYAAKGLPMVFSEKDPGFENVNFIYKALENENLLNIREIIKWYKNLKMSSEEIREFSKKFDWNIQMKKVLNEL